jgi:hypothetical protein
MAPSKKAATPAHVISLRKLSEDLYWRIKVRAAESRQGVEEYIMGILDDATKKTG